ncbi:MAG: chemotaxis protein CheA [Panacagrimonas sp.]
MGTGVDDDVRNDFLIEAGELLQTLGGQLVELESRPSDPALLNAIFRAFHTIKGGAGFLALGPMVELCHVAEEVFDALRSGRRSVDAVLLDAALKSLDQLQCMLDVIAAGQAPASPPPELLVQLRAQAAPSSAITEDEFEALLDELHGKKSAPQPAPSPASHAAVQVPTAAVPEPAARPGSPPAKEAREAERKAPVRDESIRVDTARLDRMMNLVGELVLVRNRLKATGAGDAGMRAIRDLDVITRSLQDAVMRVRMQPIGKLFSRFPKLARDVARGLGKQIEVDLQGADTDLDKNLVEALSDPLVHMVRNSVDHGIEMPEQRRAAGKPLAGRLSLAAMQQGQQIVITISDDGAGMNCERLRAKAVDKGLMDGSTAAALSPQQCLELVFLPGFSTRDVATDLSGRGVGMDVVKSAIDRLGGSVAIESSPGIGSRFTLRLPLTLAILPALLVNVRDRRYALPLASVNDVFALDTARTRRLDHWDVVPQRDGQLRLIDLERWCGHEPEAGPRHVVVVTVGSERYGLVVHQVRSREEIVVKPLGASIRGLAGVAGASVTPEGRVILILDPAGLLRAGAASPPEAAWTS